MIVKSHFVSSEIKKKMVEKRITQTKLSGLLGWKTKNAQYVSNIVRGKCQFPVKDINRLCEILEFDLHEMAELFASDYKFSLLNEAYKNKKND